MKRNPITVARQIDYVFKQLWGKVILSGMHRIGQVLGFDDRRKFENRGTEHIHASIHIVDAPKIDENEESEVVEFIVKYNACALRDETKCSKRSNLVKRLQTHHHTTTFRKKKGVDLMRKASKEAYKKEIKGKILCIGNTFWNKREVSTHEAVKKELSLPMRHSNIDVFYVPISLKKIRTRMLNSLSILEKMHPDDTNVFAPIIIHKYENRPNNLHTMCLADFTSSYITKKANDLPIEPDSYTVPVSNSNDVKLNPNIVVLKNELGEMLKRS